MKSNLFLATIYILVLAITNPKNVMANDEGHLEKVKRALGGLIIHEMPIQYHTQKTFLAPNGDRLSIRDFSGKTTFVNFWATWCAPCVREMPAISALKKATKEKINVITIAVGRHSKEDFERFYKNTGIKNLVEYTDEKHTFSAAYDALGLPTTLIFDKNGQEIARLQGEARWDHPKVIEWLGNL